MGRKELGTLFIDEDGVVKFELYTKNTAGMKLVYANLCKLVFDLRNELEERERENESGASATRAAEDQEKLNENHSECAQP